MPVVGVLVAVIAVLALTQPTCADDELVVSADTLVVGGGLAGLYFADQWLTSLNSRAAGAASGENDAGLLDLVLLEREADLGGRAVDAVFSDVPDVWAGLGPWRYHAQAHALVAEQVRRFGFATRPFDIDLAPPPQQWLHVGGALWNRDADFDSLLLRHFPTLAGTNFSVDGLLRTLRQRHGSLSDSGGFRALVRQEFGVDGERLMRLLEPTYMSNGDLWSTLDVPDPSATGDADEADDADVRTIVGGWSRMVRALGDAVAARPRASVRVRHEVRAVDEVLDDDGVLWYYVDAVVRNGTLPFPRVTFRAKRLVLAAPVPALAALGGSVAERLQATAEFRSVVPVPVGKAAAVWPSAWWEAAVEDGGLGAPANQSVPGPAMQSLDECFSIWKYYWARGRAGETVAHNAYVTDDCAMWFGDMLRTGDARSATAELHRALVRMFPRLSVQPPIDAAFRFWPAGWHMQSPHTFSMQQIATWAVYPLGRAAPGVSLVGEAFSRGPRGWTNPAWQLVRDVIRQKFEPAAPAP